NVAYMARLIAAWKMRYFPLLEAHRREAIQEGLPELARESDGVVVELLKRLLHWGNELVVIEGGTMVFDLLSTEFASLPVVLDTALPSPLAECHLIHLIDTMCEKHGLDTASLGMRLGDVMWTPENRGDSLSPTSSPPSDDDSAASTSAVEAVEFGGGHEDVARELASATLEEIESP
ncbi:hypothetical protein MNV49_002062, partial [Pseudohyphozyma bogoriensis]